MLEPRVLTILAGAVATVAAGAGAVGCGSTPPVKVEPDRPERAGIVVEDVGFETPQAAVYDDQADVYLVSNANGELFEADGNGFISRVAPDGTVAELAWIKGGAKGVTLDAPRGMAIDGDKLFVADLHTVRVFARDTGEAQGEIAIEGATFLSGMFAWDGSVFVTDAGLQPGSFQMSATGTDAVYQIDPTGRVRAVFRGPELEQPTGVAVDSDGIWVVSYGGNTLKLLGEREIVRTKELPRGVLDGVVLLPDGTFLISSWQGRSVYLGPTFEPVVTEAGAPGQVGYDGKRDSVLIPLLHENALWIFPLAGTRG